MNTLLILLFSLLPHAYSQYVADPTSVTGTISQTTTKFYTPPTRTSTFFITYTPPTSVKMITQTATPSTSVVVSMTVANINIGGGKVSKLPKFLAGNLSNNALSYPDYSSKSLTSFPTTTTRTSLTSKLTTEVIRKVITTRRKKNKKRRYVYTKKITSIYYKTV